MDPAHSLAGRTVLVTGASSGLGAHFAALLARCGARVAIAARRLDQLERLAGEIAPGSAGTIVPIGLDVSDETSVERGLGEAVRAFGGLDVLVNNAGIVVEGPAIDQPASAFDRVLDTNLRGAWLCATQAARLWRQRGSGGNVVNIASITGIRPAGGAASYSVSKAGLIQMTRSLALEWARFGIRVNALAPGYIETPLNAAFFASDAGKALIRRVPMRRLGRPEDLDGPFLLLAGEGSRFMTGSVLTVDGGHLVSSL